MKNIGKRKILRFIILMLCVLIFANAFLALRRWIHSDGMHFIVGYGYGQIHLSKMCEGKDGDRVCLFISSRVSTRLKTCGFTADNL